VADAAALRRAQRPKQCKLAGSDRLRAEVERGLGEGWSPQQIAARLSVDFADDDTMRVSHETIYLTLFVQARGGLRRELARALRTGRAMRYPRGKRLPQGRGQLVDTVPISERPAEVEDRAVPGHWEGDLVFGARPSAVATLVERRTRFVQVVALAQGYKAEQVRDALTAAVQRLPSQLRKSLTWDHGKEMAEHARFSVDTGVAVYFRDPHSPWHAAATRTPTVCCASTYRRTPTYAASTRTPSTSSPTASTTGLDKPWPGRHHQKPSRKRCADPLRPPVDPDAARCRMASGYGMTGRWMALTLTAEDSDRTVRHVPI